MGPVARARRPLPEGLQLTLPDCGFFQLLWSDYLRVVGDRHGESTLRAACLAPLRFAFNPSLQFSLLLRLAQRGPQLVQYPVRWLQVVLFSSEAYWFRGNEERITIGPAVFFPHPIGIMIGPGTAIGSHVTIYNNVNLGTDRSGTPEDVWRRASTIGDRARLYPYSTVQGPHTVWQDAVVGMHLVLGEDVPAGALKTRSALRLAGSWDRAPATPDETESD